MKITARKLRQFICEAISREQFKVPAEWLTREVLEDIDNAYVSQSLPKTELGSVIWDKLHDLGIEELPQTFSGTVKGFYTGSVLHRWFVVDAIKSAESSMQNVKCKKIIEATRAWVNDPSEKNRIAAKAAVSSVGGNDPYRAAYVTHDLSAAIAAADTAYYDGGPAGASYVAVQAAYYAADADPSATDAAWHRMLVLAALDTAGILPTPNI
jgi:hypothetical protein